MWMNSLSGMPWSQSMNARLSEFGVRQEFDEPKHVASFSVDVSTRKIRHESPRVPSIDERKEHESSSVLLRMQERCTGRAFDH